MKNVLVVVALAIIGAVVRWLSRRGRVSCPECKGKMVAVAEFSPSVSTHFNECEECRHRIVVFWEMNNREGSTFVEARS